MAVKFNADIEGISDSWIRAIRFREISRSVADLGREASYPLEQLLEAVFRAGVSVGISPETTPASLLEIVPADRRDPRDNDGRGSLRENELPAVLKNEIGRMRQAIGMPYSRRSNGAVEDMRREGFVFLDTNGGGEWCWVSGAHPSLTFSDKFIDSMIKHGLADRRQDLHGKFDAVFMNEWAFELVCFGVTQKPKTRRPRTSYTYPVFRNVFGPSHEDLYNHAIDVYNSQSRASPLPAMGP